MVPRGPHPPPSPPKPWWLCSPPTSPPPTWSGRCESPGANPATTSTPPTLGRGPWACFSTCLSIGSTARRRPAGPGPRLTTRRPTWRWRPGSPTRTGGATGRPRLPAGDGPRTVTWAHENPAGPGRLRRAHHGVLEGRGGIREAPRARLAAGPGRGFAHAPALRAAVAAGG